MKIRIEIFKPIIIDSIETNYLVSDHGNVKSGKSNKLLKPQKFNNGREYVNIYMNKVMKHKLISRLVAEAFIENPDNLPVVNHLDGDIGNNYITNLEWTTFKGNTIHALENGLITSIGEESHLNRYAEELVIYICDELMTGKTPREISDMTGMSQAYVTEIREKKVWRHITKNYEFPDRSIFNYSGKYPIEVKEKIAQCIKEGLRNKEIREKLSLEHTGAVRNMIDRIRKRIEDSG
jgi:NUMOD4 motif